MSQRTCSRVVADPAGATGSRQRGSLDAARPSSRPPAVGFAAGPGPRALRLGAHSPLLPALPPGQFHGLLSVRPSLPEAAARDEARENRSLRLLRKQNGFLTTSILVLEAIYGSGNSPGWRDCSCLLLGPSGSSVPERFSIWQVEAEGGNQALGTLNAKCIHLIYSDKFSSGYFLYYQTRYPSVKTFVLAE